MEFDEDTYIIKVDGLVENIVELKINSLRNEFEQVEVVAALQVCMNTLVYVSYLGLKCDAVCWKPKERNVFNQRG